MSCDRSCKLLCSVVVLAPFICIGMIVIFRSKANCDYEGTIRGMNMCQNSGNNSESCICPFGVKNLETGRCEVGYLESCDDEDHPCMDELVCHLDTCRCRYDDQHYDFSGSQKCISRVGRYCKDSSMCVENADCQLVGMEDFGTCSCKPGFIKNEDSGCALTYGQNCNIFVPAKVSRKSTVLHRRLDPCAQNAGLTCINGVCECRKFGIFNPEDEACLGFVDTPCDVRLIEGKEKQCVANAICRKKRTEYEAFCTCDRGFVKNSNFTCSPDGVVNISR